MIRVIREGEIPHDVLCDFDLFYSSTYTRKKYSGVLIEGGVLRNARQGDIEIINGLGQTYPIFLTQPEELRSPVSYHFFTGHEQFRDFLEEAQRFEPRSYRVSDRIPLELNARICLDASGEHALQVKTLNLSETGCALEAAHVSISDKGGQVDLPQPGTELVLMFDAEKDMAPIPATVCWFSDHRRDAVDIGLRFRDLSKEQLEKLKHLILTGLLQR